VEHGPERWAMGEKRREATMTELADIARAVITANNYLALGTADASGIPWVSPLYYTPDGYTDFYWASCSAFTAPQPPLDRQAEPAPTLLTTTH
jgi:Pyridoxamine 5'-phosphate oxidase